MQNNTQKALGFLVLFAVTIFAACQKTESTITPVEKVTSSLKNISGVDALIVNDAFEVIVKISESEENVVIETNENLHDLITLNHTGGTLEIGVENPEKIEGNTSFRATVTSKSVNRFQASGMSSIVAQDSIIQSNVQVDLSGASSFKAKMEVSQLNAALSGESSMDIAGICSTFELEMSEASFVNGYDLNTNTFKGNFRGASSANLTILNAIYLDAYNLCVLRFRGRARIKNQNLLGGSSILNIP